MTDLELLGAHVGSLRYARDLIESPAMLRTRPWWGMQNKWGSKERDALIRARLRKPEGKTS